MTAKFQVVLHKGDANDCIVDESFNAESVEQILQCKRDDVVHVEAVKVCDIDTDHVEQADVWLNLCSMRDNLAEASLTVEQHAAQAVFQHTALCGLTALLR